MRFSTIHSGMAALALIAPVVVQSQGFSACLQDCRQAGAPLGDCLGGSEEEEVTYCDCDRDYDVPDIEGAECLKACADEFDIDHTAVFRDTCDALFEGLSAEGPSSSAAESSPSQTGTGEPTASETEQPSGTEEPSASGTEESSESETPDAAAAPRDISALVLAGGLAVALL